MIRRRDKIYWLFYNSFLQIVFLKKKVSFKFIHLTPARQIYGCPDTKTKWYLISFIFSVSIMRVVPFWQVISVWQFDCEGTDECWWLMFGLFSLLTSKLSFLSILSPCFSVLYVTLSLTFILLRKYPLYQYFINYN